MVLRDKTLAEHLRDILSPENRFYTMRDLQLDREPTYQELLAHYERFNIISHVHKVEIDNGDDIQFSHG